MIQTDLGSLILIQITSNERSHNQLVSFGTVVALWTLVTLLMKLIRMLLKWKYIHCKNYAILAAIIRKRSYFVEKFRPGHPGWSVHMGKFSSRLPRSRSPGQPGLSYEHIEIFTKERAARRDLGNRASLVDRVHMKRPSDYAELGHFTSLFCRGRQRNVQRFRKHVPAIVLLIEPFVCWCSGCRRRRGCTSSFAT